MAEVAVTIAEAEPRYRLPSHVFACRHGSHLVFLDVAADRYFAVEVASGGIGRHAPELVARGLLTQDPWAGRALAPLPIGLPVDDLTDAGSDVAPRLELRDVWRFAVSTAVAWLAVKCLPLERLARRVSRRRARESARRAAHAIAAEVRAGAARGPGAPADAEVDGDPGASPPFDLAVAKRCAAVYERLRPLAFTARDACLLQSCAFLEFAARYGLYPMWVFGVQATPFAAHCWVQHEGLVLNDAAEHAAAFAPIMLA